MNLEQMLKETDALTYLNALKVTLTEIKEEVSNIDELTGYVNQSMERIRKLQRKADNQYRVVAKIVNKESPVVTDLTIEENVEEFDNMKGLMEQ